MLNGEVSLGLVICLERSGSLVSLLFSIHFTNYYILNDNKQLSYSYDMSPPRSSQTTNCPWCQYQHDQHQGVTLREGERWRERQEELTMWLMWVLLFFLFFFFTKAQSMPTTASATLQPHTQQPCQPCRQWLATSQLWWRPNIANHHQSLAPLLAPSSSSCRHIDPTSPTIIITTSTLLSCIHGKMMTQCHQPPSSSLLAPCRHVSTAPCKIVLYITNMVIPSSDWRVPPLPTTIWPPIPSPPTPLPVMATRPTTT